MYRGKGVGGRLLKKIWKLRIFVLLKTLVQNPTNNPKNLVDYPPAPSRSCN